jgi:hypothetical protein
MMGKIMYALTVVIAVATQILIVFVLAGIYSAIANWFLTEWGKG